ncbi:unnamed protein product [Anisakis simplex]|uniref:Membralin (inferred by orthology to a human protein) n=1 Tax=Anisakis simplex TaxID=6269 RepID=A0A0M3K907_ANISI|nr:unnamed protein product [Anisakis simplex]
MSGAVRDRLFHAMLVRMALSYTRHVPRFGRRFIEFFVLLIAILLLCLMIYVHIIFNRNDSRCLSDLIDKWPRDGVLRVEVISDLHKFYAYQDRAFERWNNEQKNSTEFSLKRILQEGPKALPKELRKGGGGGSRFFYLYHFGFYAYQYRYNGQYGGLALLASTFFILVGIYYLFVIIYCSVIVIYYY